MAPSELYVEIRSRRIWLIHLIKFGLVLPRKHYLWCAKRVLQFVVVEMRYGQNEWQRLNLWQSIEIET